MTSTTVAAAAAKSLQSCPTLCGPIEGSPPGFPIPGILQARTLEWVAISFTSALEWEVKVKSLSRVWLLATPWTAAHQAPPSMGISRQEHWSGVLSPSLSTTVTKSQKGLSLCRNLTEVRLGIPHPCPSSFLFLRRGHAGEGQWGKESLQSMCTFFLY